MTEDVHPGIGPWANMGRVVSTHRLTVMVTDPTVRKVCKYMKVTATELVVDDCELYPWAQAKDLPIMHLCCTARTSDGHELMQVTYSPGDLDLSVRLAAMKMVLAITDRQRASAVPQLLEG